MDPQSLELKHAMGLSFLTERSLLYGVILLCLCALSYLNLTQRHRDILLRPLQIKKRRSDSVETPPGSLGVHQAQRDAITEVSEYTTIFPPSQRDQLQGLARSMPSDQSKQLGSFIFDQMKFQKSLLSFEEDFRKASESAYCYSGFSVKEIRALGDFPNYAALSGVPLPQPYRDFDIATALPRPYRPFRWAYHQTMSLTKLDTDWWLELESTYKERITQRKTLYAEYGPAVLQCLPGSELACKELMEMALQFLCARYPHYFELAPSPMDTKKTIFTNKILNTSQVVQEKHPLLVLLNNLPEDFALMIRHPETGYYHFRAGVICSALGWSLGSKIGKQLHEIHGPVPDYKEKMQFSMDRFFTKMPTFKPIQRGSWGFEIDQPLFMPPGDPQEQHRDVQSPDMTLERLHLRVDWQTLRRLPLSGAVAFNFKALFTPITEFRNEPKLPSLLIKILTEGKENLLKYKNTWHLEHVTMPAFEAWAREQMENGLCPNDWEPRTLDESPFFEGWEEKWHRQQGF